jgi:hypothetical protein
MKTFLQLSAMSFWLISGFTLSQYLFPPIIDTSPVPHVVKGEVIPPTTEQMVREMAIEYGVNPDTAVRIANCESMMGKYKYNFEGSSAKGLFQFIDRTWKYYCKGDVLNNEDNARCFMELYPKHPSWWSCL